MITTTISNSEIVKKYKDKIDLIKKKMKDLTKPLQAFEKYYKGIIKKNYYSDGAIFTNGGKWPDLNEEYLEWKRVMLGQDLGDGRKVVRTEKLRLTDTLRKEVFSQNSVKVNKNSIRYDIKQVYARIHQFGGSTGRGNIPPRPYLFSNETKGLRKEDTAVLYKILEKYLIKEQENE